MRHLPVEPPPFFHRGPSPLARLAVFGLLSLALLFADTRYRYLENIRHGAATVLYPLQRVVQLPGEALAYVGTYFSSQRALADDNAALKAQLLGQAPVVQGYPLVEQENARLRALLKLETRVPRRRDRGRGALLEPRPVHAEALRRQGRGGGRAGRPGGDRQHRRRRAGDARVSLHVRGDARHRQGPRRARQGRAQRRAHRHVRRRRGAAARAALPVAQRRDRAGRPAGDVGHRRHVSGGPRGRRRWSRSSARPGRASRT